MSKDILCYYGKTTRAIEGNEPRRKSDFLNYLYNSESNTVILEDSKGTIILAHRVTSGKEEYLQGEKVIVDKKTFLETIDKCVELSQVKDSAFELFSKCLENRVRHE